MDLISRRNWKSSEWLSQRNGTIKFWKKKGTTVFVYKPYETTGLFQGICEYCILIYSFHTSKRSDYLNLSDQCEQKFGSPVRQNLKQVNINQL